MAGPAPRRGRPLAAALLVAGSAVAGCLSGVPGSHGPIVTCDAGVLPEGREVRVRVVWDDGGAPVEGACARAWREGTAGVTDVRTDRGGEAVLRLPDGAWRVTALRETQPGSACAYMPARPSEDLQVAGPTNLTLRLVGQGGSKLCA